MNRKRENEYVTQYGGYILHCLCVWNVYKWLFLPNICPCQNGIKSIRNLFVQWYSKYPERCGTILFFGNSAIMQYVRVLNLVWMQCGRSQLFVLVIFSMNFWVYLICFSCLIHICYIDWMNKIVMFPYWCALALSVCSDFNVICGFAYIWTFVFTSQNSYTFSVFVSTFKFNCSAVVLSVCC